MTIHWSIQCVDAHPDLARGIPPPHWLSAPEILRFSRLKSDRRRREWLIGRWTAKRLLLAMVMSATGRPFFYHQIAIENDRDRAPYGLMLLPQGWQTLPYSLSISHSSGRALCAALDGALGTVGADLERIEARSPAFVETYFTPSEIEQVRRAGTPTRAMMITAIWSAKEAALKALHLGLSVDTRALTCHLNPPAGAMTAWTAFEIEPDGDRLPTTTPDLMGWWRRQGDFVLTLAHATHRHGKAASKEQNDVP